MNKIRALLINKFPFWIYQDGQNTFFDEVDELIVLHSNKIDFDFPSNDYSSVVICDFENSDEMWNAIDFLFKTRNFNFVINLSEQTMELAAEIREKFNLPGMHLKEVLPFRDKLMMKDIVRKYTNIRVPHYKKIHNSSDIYKFYEKNKKSIIKQKDGMGSKNIFVINNCDDIRGFLNEISDLHNYEVEEFINGDIYHCDSIVKDGNILVSSVSKYSCPPMNFKTNEYLYSNMINSGSLKNKVIKANKEIINSFGLMNGVTHLEVFVDNDEIVFCEIACRAGGAGVIPSIREVFGVNLFHASINLQINKQITIREKPIVAGWLVLYKKEGVIKEISSKNEFKHNWIKYCSVKGNVGDTVESADSSTASIAEFTIIGNNESDLKEKMDYIIKEFKYQVI
ncbi:ATP-grasp domain-containing protein [Evansella caseinilytica]|uniref:ATP-grasp domain-containing protein n=1 Tax=Evansella caseinilytica TaxID=1503961 RepID=A0A1H3LA97_9BACI|nr:ATP-grasp domain-containing protein [Evansella caseinilytica]SDY61311.1 ATP-grasp domain-containing protein [Evansella caseinilytica]